MVSKNFYIFSLIQKKELTTLQINNNISIKFLLSYLLYIAFPIVYIATFT